MQSKGNYVKDKKKWGLGRQRRHREISSFIPLYREPSSIEKILADIDKEKQSKAPQVRKSYRALKAIARLQKMMRGQSIKRQTSNTMRSMQLLVRIQTEIHARRLQMMQNPNIHQQTLEGEDVEEWDDSMLTKEERNARLRRKVEAVIKRERALAYAYSHQLLTVTPKTANTSFSDARSGGLQFWWNWRELQVPCGPQHPKTPAPASPKTSAITPTASAALLRRSRRKPERTPLEASTPVSVKSIHTHNSSNRWQATHVRSVIKDDDSLTSCPPFMAPSAAAMPSYMAPTVSAKAKVRATSVESGGKERERRFSFAPTQGIGSLRQFMAMKGSAQPATAPEGKHRAMRSIGELSVDSTVSLPAALGRRRLK
ncbi:Protein IQ-domain 14 [Apostasia shenzhenica]|uniref:Protein IQ-domain 14 n=1 Tax=Apostasia shenzhenica TaxID=1088818 RepID=A0A2I0AUR4_9ASPA|nr:Protein IQ-domain 14 [Apostasia shenzhenica]